LEGKLIQVFENLGRKNAADIWLRDDDSVYTAIKKMAENRIGALLVNSNNVFAGIFTERDYLNKIILQGRSSKQTKLKEVMTKNPHFIAADFPIKDCLNMALQNQFRHVPIVSLLGNEINVESLVGMVTINDIIAYLMLELEVKRLKRISPDLR
jgi:CBS domain-containing protein